MGLKLDKDWRREEMAWLAEKSGHCRFDLATRAAANSPLHKNLAEASLHPSSAETMSSGRKDGPEIA
jgi:hypothetical protein